jgi:hypothetical protein
MKKIIPLLLLLSLCAAGCNQLIEVESASIVEKKPTLTLPASKPSPTPQPVPVTPPQVAPKPAPVTPPPASNCDPNYTGCVPIASDVDCAGGSGNGPAYVRGPVRVIGSDIYGLDRDGDGVACQ